MARSLLQSFVSGTRQMLAVQLFVSVGTVALAGYTAMVTNRAIADRNREHERVIQLEQELGRNDILVPEQTTIPVQQETENLYPPAIETPAVTEVSPGETQVPEATPVDNAPPAPTPHEETPGQAPPTPTEQTSPTPTTTTETAPAFDPARLLQELLTPPPPLHNVVLHVRAQDDVEEAQVIARSLIANNMAVSIDVMTPNDPRESGYAYFHGRQGRAAAATVQQLQDAARGAEIAPWVATLRGTALPASGEYTADRLDVVLPALPAQDANPELRRQFDPRLLQQYRVIQQAPQQPPVN